MDSSAASVALQFSPKPRRATRRIVVFSLLVGFAALLVSALVFSGTEVWIPLDRLHEINQDALRRIHCDAQSCDETELSGDWTLTDPDYVLDKATNFILEADFPGAEFAGFPLHFSDPTFIRRFGTPDTVLTPAGESWRLLSGVKQVGSRQIAIMVGYAERASWKLGLPVPSANLIDSELKQQLLKIEDSLAVNGLQEATLVLVQPEMER